MPTAFHRNDNYDFERIDYGVPAVPRAKPAPAVMSSQLRAATVFITKISTLVSQSFSSVRCKTAIHCYILSDSEKQSTTHCQAIFEDTGATPSRLHPVLRTLHEGFVDNDLKIGCLHRPPDYSIGFHKYQL